MKLNLKQHAPDLINVCAMPGDFHKAIGYTGQADYLAVWWDFPTDQLAWCDGITEIVGATWEPYMYFMEHKLAKMLSEYDQSEFVMLGSSFVDADWWLILDIKNQDCYVAPRNQAKALINAAAGDTCIDDLDPVLVGAPAFYKIFGKPVVMRSKINDVPLDWIKEIKFGDPFESTSIRSDLKPGIASRQRFEFTGFENFIIKIKGMKPVPCICSGGWLFDQDLYSWIKHNDCQGVGMLLPSQLNIG